MVRSFSAAILVRSAERSRIVKPPLLARALPESRKWRDQRAPSCEGSVCVRSGSRSSKSAARTKSASLLPK